MIRLISVVCMSLGNRGARDVILRPARSIVKVREMREALRYLDVISHLAARRPALALERVPPHVSMVVRDNELQDLQLQRRPECISIKVPALQ